MSVVLRITEYVNKDLSKTTYISVTLHYIKLFGKNKLLMPLALIAFNIDAVRGVCMGTSR